MDKGPKKRKVEQKGLKQKNIVIDASVRQNVNVNSSVNSPPVLNEEEEDRVWTWCDSSGEQGQVEEAAAEDKRHDTLAGDATWSDSVDGARPEGVYQT